MKTYSHKVFLALFLFGPPATAQQQSLDINLGTQMVKYNDPTTIGRKTVDIDYSEIGGQYLWNRDWSPALIIMKGGNATKMKAVRLNLYSNDVHYLTNEGEMAAPINKIKRIIMYSNNITDTTAVAGTFDVLPNLTTRKDLFYEVMNEGKIELLKRITVTLKKEAFN